MFGLILGVLIFNCFLFVPVSDVSKSETVFDCTLNALFITTPLSVSWSPGQVWLYVTESKKPRSTIGLWVKQIHCYFGGTEAQHNTISQD